MTERHCRQRQEDPGHGLRLVALLVLLLVAVAGLPSRAALAGLAVDPGAGGHGDRAAAAALLAAERDALRRQLTERRDRLLRERAVLAATQRSADLRLRRLAVDFATLAEARAATAAALDSRAAAVVDLRRRLESLLAEIVQLSRGGGDPRRLAQLRAIAAALAQPFAEAQQALAQSRAAAAAHDAAEVRLERANIDAQQAFADAAAGQARLAAAIDATTALATTAAARALAARRLAARLAARLEAADEAVRLAALRSVVADRAVLDVSRLPPLSQRLQLPGLRARALLAGRAERPTAPLGLQPGVAAVRGPSGGRIMPVAGAVVGRFDDGREAPFDRGLTIEVAERRLVRAPRDGRVVFARTYEGFGLLLIIDHGDEYHSLLSGLSRFVVHEGWAVRGGQMVGIIEPGTTAAGRLYVELRRRGVPVDPLLWFAAGQDKVRS